MGQHGAAGQRLRSAVVRPLKRLLIVPQRAAADCKCLSTVKSWQSQSDGFTSRARSFATLEKISLNTRCCVNEAVARPSRPLTARSSRRVCNHPRARRGRQGRIVDAVALVANARGNSGQMAFCWRNPAKFKGCSTWTIRTATACSVTYVCNPPLFWQTRMMHDPLSLGTTLYVEVAGKAVCGRSVS
jgi:hypothetical protein